MIFGLLPPKVTYMVISLAYFHIFCLYWYNSHCYWDINRLWLCSHTLECKGFIFLMAISFERLGSLNFIERLNNFVDWSEINLRDLARKAGVGYDTVRELKRGRTQSITVDNAKAILDALDLSFEHIYPRSSSGDDNVMGVPRYRVMASAGHGALNESQEFIDYIPFTPEFFIRRLNRQSTRGLMICETRGDSMSPTIGDRDLIMIDGSPVDEQNLKDFEPGLYALDYDNETVVKRVEKTPGGYLLISDNALYPPVRIEGSDLHNLKFIGKVVWISRTL